MARLRVIVLDSPDQSNARANFRIAFWLDVPAARQKFYAAMKPAPSAWIDAQAGDNTAIANGSVVERIITYAPEGNKSVNQMETEVAALWTAEQARVTAFNPWPNYGSSWDGTTWSIVSVA